MRVKTATMGWSRDASRDSHNGLEQRCESRQPQWSGAEMQVKTATMGWSRDASRDSHNGLEQRCESRQPQWSGAEMQVETATMVGQIPNPGCRRIWLFWSSVMGQILSRSISRRSACSTQTSRTGCTGHSGMPVAPLALSGPVSSLQEAWCLNGHLSYRCQRAHETGLNNRFAVLSCSA